MECGKELSDKADQKLAFIIRYSMFDIRYFNNES